MKFIALILVFVSLAVVPVVNADGTLDPSFGHGGLVVTQFGVIQRTIAMSVAVQPDGRAVASGWTNVNLEQTFMAAARYLPSGELDPEFSADGIAVVPFSGMPPGLSTSSLRRRTCWCSRTAASSSSVPAPLFQPSRLHPSRSRDRTGS
jgi:hypothetical protein